MEITISRRKFEILNSNIETSTNIETLPTLHLFSFCLGQSNVCLIFPSYLTCEKDCLRSISAWIVAGVIIMIDNLVDVRRCRQLPTPPDISIVGEAASWRQLFSCSPVVHISVLNINIIHANRLVVPNNIVKIGKTC